MVYVNDRIVEIWVKKDVLEKDIAYSIFLYEVDIVRNRSNLLQVTSYDNNKTAVDFSDFSDLPQSWTRHSPNTIGEGMIQAGKAIMRIEELYLTAKQKIKNFRLKKSEFIQLMITNAEYQILFAATLGLIDDENGDDFFDSIGENLWYIEDIIEHEYKEK